MQQETTLDKLNRCENEICTLYHRHLSQPGDLERLKLLRDQQNTLTQLRRREHAVRFRLAPAWEYMPSRRE
jgi:hypothetical protein